MRKILACMLLIGVATLMSPVHGTAKEFRTETAYCITQSGMAAYHVSAIQEAPASMFAVSESFIAPVIVYNQETVSVRVNKIPYRVQLTIGKPQSKSLQELKHNRFANSK